MPSIGSMSMATDWTRRRMIAVSVAGLAGAFSGCRLRQDDTFMADDIDRRRGDPRLRSRVHAPRDASGETGSHRIEVDSGRDALLYIPENAKIPLAVMLHGAGQEPEYVMSPLAPIAENEGVAILAPASLDATWDGIREGFGPDVRRIDDALADVFDRWSIDAARVGLGGFSDGASYALGLGLANGDFFSSIMAFSAGFIPPMEPKGRPRVFLSHGTRDQILPIERCGRVVAEQLRRHRYPLVYREFDGPHTVPKPVAAEALHWFVQRA
jgi:phospholipase/carboxylesterase